MLYPETEKSKKPTNSFLNIRFPRHNPDLEIEVRGICEFWICFYLCLNLFMLALGSLPLGAELAYCIFKGNAIKTI